MQLVAEQPDPLLEGAAAVARGVSRLFARHDIYLLSEMALPNGRRADLMGVDAKGHIVIVEIKVSKADLIGDHKWPEYLEYCDRFFWAVSDDIEANLLTREIFEPERTGLIIADSFDGEMVRPAKNDLIAAARRKKMTQLLARRAMMRIGVSNGWLETGPENYRL